MYSRIFPLFFLALSLTLSTVRCWAVPQGAIPPSQAGRTDEEQARLAYNIGLPLAEKGDQSTAAAEAATDTAAREAALEAARASYTEARAKFQEAAKFNADMPGAWNMVGYTERKLGNYDQALAAYERALGLNPSYAQAIEYRAEAYLGLNRIADAKQAYLDLFASNRALSEQFLGAAKKWVAARRKSPGDVSAATINDMDSWTQERTRIAAKTASLTREGAAASWK